MELASNRGLAAKRLVLHGHSKRTGVDLSQLLAICAESLPEGFNAEEIDRFYHGQSIKVQVERLDYVIGLWRALPSRGRLLRATGTTSRREKVLLTSEIRNELQGHWLRVGLSIEAIFGRMDAPRGLNPRIIRYWLGNNPPRQVKKTHLETVLKAWRAMPSGLGRTSRIHFIPFAQAKEAQALAIQASRKD